MGQVFEYKVPLDRVAMLYLQLPLKASGDVRGVGHLGGVPSGAVCTNIASLQHSRRPII